MGNDPKCDIAHWSKDKTQIFFAFDSSSKDVVSLPSTVFQDWKLHCSIATVDKNMALSGYVSKEDMTGENLKISAKIVNFRNDRWKKTACHSDMGKFEIQSILSYPGTQ
ncbi:MAG: hypothetical protein ABJI93_01575 [Nonlabens ulvanivorans]|uniref:hypothetical protein n=1 Tax=Nonlabens ulvanivorans TaxID=906888 RepID=UPI0032980539